MIDLTHPGIIDSATGLGSAAFGMLKSLQSNKHEISLLEKHIFAERFEISVKDTQTARKDQSLFMSVARMLCLIFIIGGLSLTLLLAGILHWDVTVETTHATGWLLHFLHGPTTQNWHTSQGLVIPQWIQLAAFMILGFYFGRST